MTGLTGLTGLTGMRSQAVEEIVIDMQDDLRAHML
jgi:hypothetical protein